jgi:DNA helicase HerA-like ATPase
VAADHDWHRNVRDLLDLEYAVKLLSGLANGPRFLQQAPSGALPHMATDAATKAHNDRPFFAAAWRIGLWDPSGRQALSALTSVSGLIQHGGRPMHTLGEQEYAQVLSTDAPLRLIAGACTHRPGFLVNASELASLVHIWPTANTAHIRATPLAQLESLAPPSALADGTPLGYCACAGERRPVCIPYRLRKEHVHVMGRSGVGKSTMLEGMILDDIAAGAGVAIFDPHGDLIQSVLARLPLSHADRTVYLDPGDPDWVPLWNPLQPRFDHERGRTADDLVAVFKSFVEGWGDRLEHLLRHVFYGAMSLSECTFLDVYHLLRTKTDESEALRKAILGAVDSPAARLFFAHDLTKYGKDDLGPPRNKLSKLLLSGGGSLMLSQPESRLDLREIMEEGRILLVNLSNVGAQVRGILGSFMLAQLYIAAGKRSASASEERLPFHIYCDEAHRFATDALDYIVAEARKFNVSLVLAHQYLRQFTRQRVDSLSCAGSAVIFNVDAHDAQFLKKDFRGQVTADDIIALEPYQAIGRISGHVVRFNTYDHTVAPDMARAQAIIRQSYERYYRPAEKIKENLRQHAASYAAPCLGVSTDSGEGVFEYDTF